MHLYIVTRGIKNQVDALINDLQTKFLAWDWKEKDYQNEALQLSVRPIQLWELVMPETELPVVYNYLNPKPHNRFGIDKNILLKRALHAKSIPDIPKTQGFIHPFKSVEITPIGIREDAKNKDGRELI